ncbi:hypothetical protein [Apilactobacillus nanyangensis]|uniref:hypothetical protein n=1 Tax=Apilactobacillus nanyangensis TaxID=2799579 RepID=UPI0019434DB8|nr:hypothetical protein [Apilactobacillus nanyangensis]
MNYVNFLKQINNIDGGNWTALASRERDFTLIMVNKQPAIHVIKDNKGKTHCPLYSLNGIEDESLDLVIEFVKSNGQLDANEATTDIAEQFGMIKQFDSAGEVMFSLIEEALTEHANED